MSAGILLICLAAIAAIISFVTYLSAAGWVEHTHQVLALLGTAFDHVQDAETSQRGYLLTGDPHHLGTYEEVARGVGGDLDRLAELTTDNPYQQERIALIKPVVAERLRILQAGAAVRRSDGLEAAAKSIQTHQGKPLMDRIRSFFAEMGQEEARLLGVRQAAAR